MTKLLLTMFMATSLMAQPILRTASQYQQDGASDDFYYQLKIGDDDWLGITKEADEEAGTDYYYGTVNLGVGDGLREGITQYNTRACYQGSCVDNDGESCGTLDPTCVEGSNPFTFTIFIPTAPMNMVQVVE